MRTYGWAGLGVIGVAEALLFAGEPTVAGWFTPIVWTGYVLFIDALTARFTGRSYLTTDRVEGILVALASIVCWWLFELYNAPRFWRGGAEVEGLWWRYHGLEPNLWLRRVGYDWSFATIFPAMFLTAAVLRTRSSAALGSPMASVVTRPQRRDRRGGSQRHLALVVVSTWLVPSSGPAGCSSSSR